MTNELQGLLTEIGEKIEALVSARASELAEERMAGVRAALAGVQYVEKAGKPRKAAKVAREASEAAKRKIVAEISGLSGKDARRAAAKRHGIHLTTFYDWKRDLGVNKGGAVRRHFDDDFKRAFVAKAIVMPPGERAVFLKNEDITRNTYYKWVTWLKKNPA